MSQPFLGECYRSTFWFKTWKLGVINSHFCFSCLSFSSYPVFPCLTLCFPLLTYFALISFPLSYLFFSLFCSFSPVTYISPSLILSCHVLSYSISFPSPAFPINYFPHLLFSFNPLHSTFMQVFQ